MYRGVDATGGLLEERGPQREATDVKTGPQQVLVTIPKRLPK